MYYTIYKITNQINGKFYIGSHKTRDLNDGYMGSGKYLKHAQEKYGLENFTKEILFVFNNPDDMYVKEAEIVNEDFLSEENTYNLKLGGFGGFDYINENNLYGFSDKESAVRGRILANESLRQKYGEDWQKKISEKATLKMQEILRNDPDYLKRLNPKSFLGKTHTEETKKKIGEKNSKNQSGKKNSNYGKRWIHSPSLKRSKTIEKNQPLPDGWCEGRKIKF